MQVSCFCSSIRPNLWDAFFRSLKGTTVDVEVVFAGNLPVAEAACNAVNTRGFQYIFTGEIKPAQAYEVARRHCKGEVVVWVADDCEFPDDVIGKAYRFWKEKCSRKDVVCIRTKENYGTWRDCDETCHNFFGATPEAPKMAPIGMMSREYFEELGGIDRRFICGQWDNDLLMRIYNDGGSVRYFGDGAVLIDHAGKHVGGMKTRPFSKGFEHDRAILEGAWGKKGQMVYAVPYKRFDTGFEPYEAADLATKSQSYNLEDVFHD
jgi:hypothetical protein